MRKTPITVFHARKRLTINVKDWHPNDSGRIVIEKGKNLTREKDFLTFLRENYADAVEIEDKRLRFGGSAPITRWPDLKSFRGKVLVVTPSNAIGDNAMLLCALTALKEAGSQLDVGVAFIGAAHPVFRWDREMHVHPYVLHEHELAKYQGVIDLYSIAAWHDHVYKPFDFEGELLKAFDIPVSKRLSGMRKLPRDPKAPKIKLFPQSSTPIRGLPPETTKALAKVAADYGKVEIVLSPHQLETKPYIAALKDDLPKNATITTDIRRVRDLLRKVGEAEYGVFTDSGPCHLAKLYGVPGLAVFTSIPADLRVTRYRNFRVWQAQYKGEHCTAPCGLSMLLYTPSGKRGCWETLGPGHDAYRVAKFWGDEEEFVNFTFKNPVPCVATLRDQADEMAQFMARDIEDRLLKETPEPSGGEVVR